MSIADPLAANRRNWVDTVRSVVSILRAAGIEIVPASQGLASEGVFLAEVPGLYVVVEVHVEDERERRTRIEAVVRALEAAGYVVARRPRESDEGILYVTSRGHR